MWRRILRFVAVGFLFGACCLGVQADAGQEESKKIDNTERAPVLQYFLAVISLGITLLIVCRPSRKHQ
jgi:hypothetical protein